MDWTSHEMRMLMIVYFSFNYTAFPWVNSDDTEKKEREKWAELEERRKPGNDGTHQKAGHVHLIPCTNSYRQMWHRPQENVLMANQTVSNREHIVPNAVNSNRA